MAPSPKAEPLYSTCARCWKEFQVKARASGKYCSLACRIQPRYSRCERCQKEFKVHSGCVGKYCSKACTLARNLIHPILPCPICGKSFRAQTRDSSRPGGTKKQQKFCSRPCSRQGQRKGGFAVTHLSPRPMQEALQEILARPLGCRPSKLTPLTAYTLVTKRGLGIWSFASKREAEQHATLEIRTEITKVVVCAYCAGMALPGEVEDGYIDWRTDERGRIWCYPCETSLPDVRPTLPNKPEEAARQLRKARASFTRLDAHTISPGKVEQ